MGTIQTSVVYIDVLPRGRPTSMPLSLMLHNSKSTQEEPFRTDGDHHSCPKISVIVPVFKPGPGISRCIETLTEQTLEEVEFIFVDDCGKDDAMDLVHEASERDARIRILNNPKNLGAGPSRNAGIESARGMYLSFVDADDWVAPDFLSLLWKSAEAYSYPDIVKGVRLFVEEGVRSIPSDMRSPLNENIRDGLRENAPLWSTFRYEHQTALYKRETVLASKARYGMGRVGQDTVFLVRYCSAASSIAFADDAAYCYVKRAGSAVRSFSGGRLNERIISLSEQIDCLAAKGPEDARFVATYATRTAEYLLGMGLCIEGAAEDAQCGKGYVQDVQRQIARLPCAEQLRQESVLMRGLLDYALPLTERPYSPPGDKPYALDWLPVIRVWFRMSDIAENDRPRVLEATAAVLGRALAGLAFKQDLMGSEDDFDRASVEIRAALNACTEKRALTSLSARLSLFAKGGPNLFGAASRVEAFLLRRFAR